MRSYWIADSVLYYLSMLDWPRTQMTIDSGMFYYGWRETAPPGASRRSNYPRQWPEWVWQYNAYRAGTLGMPWGFKFVQGPGELHFDIPLLVPVALAGILPCWRLRLARRQRLRRLHGLCLDCGFNLTGNTGGTCPECGTKAPEQVKSVEDSARK